MVRAAWLWLVTSRLVTGQGHMKQRPVEGWAGGGLGTTRPPDSSQPASLSTLRHRDEDQHQQTPSDRQTLRRADWRRRWGQGGYPALVWPGSVRPGGRSSGPSQEILIEEWTGVEGSGVEWVLPPPPTPARPQSSPCYGQTETAVETIITIISSHINTIFRITGKANRKLFTTYLFFNTDPLYPALFISPSSS